MRFDAPHVAAVLWITWALYWFVAAQFVNAAKSSEGVLLRLTHTVPLAIGFLLMFHQAPHAFIYGPLHHAAPLRWPGVALTGAGLLFSVWARVHLGKYWSGIITLKEGHELIRTGPYQHVRHPLYTGFLSASPAPRSMSAPAMRLPDSSSSCSHK